MWFTYLYDFINFYQITKANKPSYFCINALTNLFANIFLKLTNATYSVGHQDKLKFLEN